MYMRPYDVISETGPHVNGYGPNTARHFKGRNGTLGFEGP